MSDLLGLVDLVIGDDELALYVSGDDPRALSLGELFAQVYEAGWLVGVPMPGYLAVRERARLAGDADRLGRLVNEPADLVFAPYTETLASVVQLAELTDAHIGLLDPAPLLRTGLVDRDRVIHVR